MIWLRRTNLGGMSFEVDNGRISRIFIDEEELD